MLPIAPGLCAIVGPPPFARAREQDTSVMFAVTLKLITGSTCLCAWARQETSAQTRNDQVWGP